MVSAPWKVGQGEDEGARGVVVHLDPDFSFLGLLSHLQMFGSL